MDRGLKKYRKFKTKKIAISKRRQRFEGVFKSLAKSRGGRKGGQKRLREKERETLKINKKCPFLGGKQGFFFCIKEKKKQKTKKKKKQKQIRRV